jgi:hypothetical protein
MLIQPEIARLLARTKIEEAQARTPPAHVLHQVSVERQSAVGSPARRVSVPSTRKWFARRASVGANAPGTTSR